MPITERNSVLLPANFVLHLNTDLPLEASKYDDIVAITGISFIDTKQVNTAPLLQLITRSTSDKSLDSSNNRGLFVVSTYMHSVPNVIFLQAPEFSG